MKHNVKFSPEQRKDKSGIKKTENVPLFADIRFAGSRVFYFTGYRTDVLKFDLVTQRMKKNTIGHEGTNKIQYNTINARLDGIKAALNKLFEGMPGKQDVIKGLDLICKKPDKPEEGTTDFLTLFENYGTNGTFSDGRKSTILSTINRWKEFATAKRLTLTFADITADTLKAFEKYLLSETIKDVNDKRAVRGVNTVHAILKLTRSFWKHSQKQGAVSAYPFKDYEIPPEAYGKPIYLTLDERNLLFNASPSINRLVLVRDIFVFQCLTGMRVGDLTKLTKKSIIDNILSYSPRKTKDNPVIVSIPLAAKAIELLDKYDLPDGRLFPFLPDQAYNTCIRMLFEEVGLKRVVTRMNPTTREPENVRLCDIASSHMARKSFVGNMFGKVDSAIIASMSGHVANSKAFTRYYDVSTELQKQAINLID